MPAALDLLEDAARRLEAQGGDDADAGATAFLSLAILTAAGWVAARFLALPSDCPAHRRMRAAATYRLERLGPRCALAHAEAVARAKPLDCSSDLLCAE